MKKQLIKLSVMMAMVVAGGVAVAAGNVNVWLPNGGFDVQGGTTAVALTKPASSAHVISSSSGTVIFVTPAHPVFQQLIRAKTHQTDNCIAITAYKGNYVNSDSSSGSGGMTIAGAKSGGQISIQGSGQDNGKGSYANVSISTDQCSPSNDLTTVLNLLKKLGM